MGRRLQEGWTEKKCSKCGEVKPKKDFYFHRTRKHYMSSCKACNTVQNVGYRRRIAGSEDAYRVLFAERAAGIKRRAKNKGIPVGDKLTETLRRLWVECGQRCYYTGRKMELTGYHDGRHNAVTIDRKIPELGYVDDNIVLCCSFVNRMKQEFSYDDLLGFCRELISVHEKEER
jgi:hypothetical protein